MRSIRNLYAITAHCTAGKNVDEIFSVPVGFRQTDVRGTEVLINGKPVKFRGTCHHDSHPLLGRAATAELTRQDMRSSRRRTSTRCEPRIIRRCPNCSIIADELGIYVEDEASFCWAERYQ